MAACAVSLYALPSRETRAQTASLSVLPMEIGPWRGVQGAELDPRSIAALGADEYVNRTYFGRDEIPVWLFVGFYASQRHGRTMHSPMNCLPGAGWLPVSHDRLEIDLAGSPVSVNRYVIQKDLSRQVVLYWYQSRGRVVASEYAARWFLAYDAMRLGRTDGAFVRVVRPVTRPGDPQEEAVASREAEAFARTVYPALARRLPS